MKEVIFTEFGAMNFGPYKDPISFDIKKNKLIMITGPNGVGKTMALDIVPFSLFGITSKELKGDEVINNEVGKNCKAWARFKVDEVEYHVTRYQKFSKFGTTVILKRGDTVIKTGHNEVVPFIEKLISSKQVFMNTRMFGQKVKTFFTDLIDSKQREIFRKVLSTEAYLTYYGHADKKLKEENFKLSTIESDIILYSNLINDTIEQIKKIKEQKKQFSINKKNNIQKLNDDIINLNKRVDEINKNIIDKEKEDIDLNKTTKEVNLIDQKLLSINNDLNKLKENLNVKKDLKEAEFKNISMAKINLVKEKIKVFTSSYNDDENKLDIELRNFLDDINLKLQELEIKKTTVSSEIEHLESSKKELIDNVINAEISICPTCHREIDEHALNILNLKIKDIEKKIKEKKEEFASLLIEKKNLLSPRAEYVKYNTELREKLVKDFNNNLNILNLEIKEIENNLTFMIQKLINSATKKLSESTTLLESDKKEKEEEKRKLKDKESKQTDIIENIKLLNKNIEAIKNEIIVKKALIKHNKEEEFDDSTLKFYIDKEISLKNKITESEKEKININKIIKMLIFWKSGFSPTGIPSMLIDEAIPFMNERVQHYLNLFSNGRYIVSFDTLSPTKAGEFKDKININLFDSETKADKKKQFSGGQIRLVDIAIILTLGDLQSKIQNISFNMILFDEIFDALDDENIGYVSKVLRKLTYDSSLFIISHRHIDLIEADEDLRLS